MKMKDSKVAKDAKAVAEHQLSFYREMMEHKEAREAFDKGYKARMEHEKKKLFIVDTIITFKHRYIVEANELEHAFDEVTMIDSGNPDDSFDELDQEFLSETIIEGREISRKKFRKMIEEMNTKCAGNAHLGERIIRKIDYDTPR